MTIEDDHKKQFEFIKNHNLKLGSKVLLNDGNIEEIAFINSHYGWFGNKHNQINIKDIKKVL